MKEWVLVPLIVALLGPGCVAALAARAGGDVTAGTRAALWSGIVGGLLVFTVWMTATYARDGRPYDPQLLRDFPHSGAPDLATLAISDALASALTLLILIPLAALAFGSLGARLPRTAESDNGTSTPRHPAPRSRAHGAARATEPDAGDRTCAVREQGRIPEASDISPATTSSCSRRNRRAQVHEPAARRRARELLTIDCGRRRAVRWPRRRRRVAWKRAARPKRLRSSEERDS